MKGTFLFIWIQVFRLLSIQQVDAQEVLNSIGFYSIPGGTAFSYAADRSFGDQYVFEHQDKNISVYLSKLATPCEGKSTLNKLIYASVMDLYNMGFYQEKGRQSAYKMKFLNAKKGNYSWYGRAKQLRSNEKIYLFFYTINDHIYRIMVYSDPGKKNLPDEVKTFIERIELKGNQ